MLTVSGIKNPSESPQIAVILDELHTIETLFSREDTTFSSPLYQIKILIPSPFFFLNWINKREWFWFRYSSLFLKLHFVAGLFPGCVSWESWALDQITYCTCAAGCTSAINTNKVTQIPGPENRAVPGNCLWPGGRAFPDYRLALSLGALWIFPYHPPPKCHNSATQCCRFGQVED